MSVFQEQPTLYDTYNAAMRALTHAEDISGEQRDRGLEQAARLLDRHGDVPNTATLGQQAVERRVDAYADDEEVDPYWEDEEDALQTLIEARGDRG